MSVLSDMSLFWMSGMYHGGRNKRVYEERVVYNSDNARGDTVIR